MDFGKMEGPVLTYGVIVGLVLGLLGALPVFVAIVPGLELIAFLLNLPLALFSLLVAVILGWYTARKIALPDMGSAAVGGGLVAVVMSIVSGLVNIAAGIVAALLKAVLMGMLINEIIFGILLSIGGGLIAVVIGCVIGFVLGAIGGAIYALTAKK